LTQPQPTSSTPQPKKRKRSDDSNGNLSFTKKLRHGNGNWNGNAKGKSKGKGRISGPETSFNQVEERQFQVTTIIGPMGNSIVRVFKGESNAQFIEM